MFFILGLQHSTATLIVLNVKTLRCPEKARHHAKTTAKNVICANFATLATSVKPFRIVKSVNIAMEPLRKNNMKTVSGNAKLE